MVSISTSLSQHYAMVRINKWVQNRCRTEETRLRGTAFFSVISVSPVSIPGAIGTYMAFQSHSSRNGVGRLKKFKPRRGKHRRRRADQWHRRCCARRHQCRSMRGWQPTKEQIRLRQWSQQRPRVERNLQWHQRHQRGLRSHRQQLRRPKRRGKEHSSRRLNQEQQEQQYQPRAGRIPRAERLQRRGRSKQQQR